MMLKKLLLGFLFISFLMDTNSGTVTAQPLLK